jgi:hypothetical protein
MAGTSPAMTEAAKKKPAHCVDGQRHFIFEQSLPGHST